MLRNCSKLDSNTRNNFLANDAAFFMVKLMDVDQRVCVMKSLTSIVLFLIDI